MLDIAVKNLRGKNWGSDIEEVCSINNGFFAFMIKSIEAIDEILSNGPYQFRVD